MIDTVKEIFFDEYTQHVQKETDIRDAGLLIMSHTEPDHAGAVAKPLDLNPYLRIMASAAALQFLQEITNKEFKPTPIKEGLRLPLGGKTLRFIDAPFLHWPDSIYTYLKEDRILFSCDSFGAHFSSSTLLKTWGVQIFALGETLKYPDALRVIEINDPADNFYRKNFMEDGVLIGEIIIAETIETGEPYSKLKRDASGKQRANKWVCRVCGYVYEGPEPPNECPVCGAGAEMFEPVFD